MEYYKYPDDAADSRRLEVVRRSRYFDSLCDGTTLTLLWDNRGSW